MNEVEIWVTDREGGKVSLLPQATLDYFELELNRPGSASISVDPQSVGASTIEGVRNEIQIWINGELFWWGPIWNLSGGPTEISVGMEGILSYLSKRFVDRTTLEYTSIDQWQIAWNLITYAQDESVEDHRDLNINASGFTNSGITRSRRYLREDHANILDLLYEFDSRTLLNGFDWEIEIDGSGGRFWTPYYPRKGSVKTNFAVLWNDEGQRTISDFTWSEDFNDLGTLVYVTGGSVTTGETTIRKEGKYENESASAYFGQMQKIISDGSQLDENWLEDRAEQEALKGSLPKTITEIQTVSTDDISVLSSLSVGDWIPVYIDHGRIQVDALHRIEKIRLDGDGVIFLTFGEVIEA